MGQDEALRIIAEVHDIEGHHDLAVRAADQRRKLWERLENKSRESLALHQLVQIHLKGEDIDLAERAANNARVLSRKAADLKGEIVSLLMLVQVHLRQIQKLDPGDLRKPSRPWATLRERVSQAAADACHLAEKAHDRNLRATCVLWRAQVLSNTDRHSEALRVAQEAENLFATSGD